jgi:hypothetical protein
MTSYLDDHDLPHATAAQRVGMLFAALQMCAFALAAAAHTGYRLTLGNVTIDEPTILPAAIVEGAIAIAIALALVLPGRGVVRAGRVLGAEVLAVIGVLVGQVALAFGYALRTRTNDLFHVAMLVVSILTMLLITRAAVRPAPRAT